MLDTQTPQETARSRRLNNRLDARILALVKDARNCGTISDGTDRCTYKQSCGSGSIFLLGLLDPDPLVGGTDPDLYPDPDPSIIKQK